MTQSNGSTENLERMRVQFSRQFAKLYDKTPLKIRGVFDERLRLFTHDQFHPLLSNHQLTGEWKGYRSINITGDWRAIFHELNDTDSIIFDAIGTHSQLYS